MTLIPCPTTKGIRSPGHLYQELIHISTTTSYMNSTHYALSPKKGLIVRSMMMMMIIRSSRQLYDERRVLLSVRAGSTHFVQEVLEAAVTR